MPAFFLQWFCGCYFNKFDRALHGQRECSSMIDMIPINGQSFRPIGLAVFKHRHGFVTNDNKPVLLERMHPGDIDMRGYS